MIEDGDITSAVTQLTQGVVSNDFVMRVISQEHAPHSALASSMRGLLTRSAGHFLPDDHRAAERIQLLERPYTILQKSALNGIECAYLISKSRTALFRSSVLTKDGSKIDEQHRRSSNRAIVASGLDEAESLILRKASEAADLPEDVWDRNVVCYGQGDVFKAHFDPIRPNPLNPGGVRRTHTNIIYLNHDYEGGETAFVAAQVAFKGRTGDLLQFRNILPDGRLDRYSLHAGLPVRSGYKWILVQWRHSDAADTGMPSPTR